MTLHESWDNLPGHNRPDRVRPEVCSWNTSRNRPSSAMNPGTSARNGQARHEMQEMQEIQRPGMLCMPCLCKRQKEGLDLPPWLVALIKRCDCHKRS
ncbi:hypothetical protein TMatcc_002987 [Talaromyces marneffei ATCC 18224]